MEDDDGKNAFRLTYSWFQTTIFLHLLAYDKASRRRQLALKLSEMWPQAFPTSRWASTSTNYCRAATKYFILLFNTSNSCHLQPHRQGIKASRIDRTITIYSPVMRLFGLISPLFRSRFPLWKVLRIKSPLLCHSNCTNRNDNWINNIAEKVRLKFNLM